MWGRHSCRSPQGAVWGRCRLARWVEVGVTEGERDAVRFQHVLERSRRAERVGWSAIGVVVGVGVLAALAVLVVVVLFVVAAVSVN